MVEFHAPKATPEGPSLRHVPLGASQSSGGEGD